MSALLLLAFVALPQDLTDETFEKWWTYVRPDEKELLWTKVKWRPTFWEAVKEAQATDKPVLLWAMNGHPLACT